MSPPAVLIDEGLPAKVAEALALLDWPANAIGDGSAPQRGSTDKANIKWCAERRAVLVTNDHGKKDRTILDHLNAQHVHAVFIPSTLRSAEPYVLARALLGAAEALGDHITRQRRLLRHRLRPSGKLEPR